MGTVGLLTSRTNKLFLVCVCEEVNSQVTALAKLLVTGLTGERSLTSVGPNMRMEVT